MAAPRGLALAVAVAAGVASPRPGHAQHEPLEPVRLRYVAPLGCSDEASALAEIIGRSSRLREARTDELALVFEMSLATQPNGELRGELRGKGLDGARVFMQTEGSCHDVIAVLAYTAAFTLDPTALASVPVEILPENPYWRWLASYPAPPAAPEAEVLPENPYWSRLGFSPPPVEDDEHVPANPYR